MTFGQELVDLHTTTPSMVGEFMCMLGGFVAVWTKNIE